MQFANAFVLLFRFLAWGFPILGAWIGEAYTGRYMAVVIGVIICGVSHIIMIGGAAPSLLQAGNGTAPFIVSLLLLAIGSGENATICRTCPTYLTCSFITIS